MKRGSGENSRNGGGNGIGFVLHLVGRQPPAPALSKTSGAGAAAADYDSVESAVTSGREFARRAVEMRREQRQRLRQRTKSNFQISAPKAVEFYGIDRESPADKIKSRMTRIINRLRRKVLRGYKRRRAVVQTDLS